MGTRGRVNAGERCCGCGTCAAVCPRGCIEMSEDACGFVWPLVDGALCVDCGACAVACPVMMAADAHCGTASEGATCSFPMAWWARARDAELVLGSSSGGLFGLLARDVLSRGGVVYGAAFTEGCRSVRHVRATAEDDLLRIMKSKYVQSTVGPGVYRALGDDMRAGIPILFSGTPCQVAGARAYLFSRRVESGASKDESVLLVDVICHGVPAPAVWGARTDGVRDRLGSSLAEVDFRDKKTGWENYSVTYRADNGRAKSNLWDRDWFMAAFLQNASLRTSCFSCPCRGEGTHASDITLGDFWGVRGAHPEVEAGAGVSAVIVRTEAGERAFERVATEVHRGRSSVDSIAAGNPSLCKQPSPHPQRDAFLGAVASGGDARYLQRNWGFGLTFGDRARRVLKRFLLER